MSPSRPFAAPVADDDRPDETPVGEGTRQNMAVPDARVADTHDVSPSGWLDSAAMPPRRVRLAGSIDVDVAIMGGGFSGLWTAYYLLEHNPRLKVAIFERHHVGYGASGRNGGWCSPRFPLRVSSAVDQFGSECARRLWLEMEQTVQTIADVCEREGIDADMRRTGILSVARGAHELPSIRELYGHYQRLGVTSYRLFTAPEVAERVNVSNVVGGLFTPAGAAINPMKLVVGLADAVERRGATIYEDTVVTDFAGGEQPHLATAAGQVRARLAIVLAGEAYLAELPRLHRKILPVYSTIVRTAPLTPAQWQRIGWQGGELLSSQRKTVDYLTRTADGRILFGSRGAPYRFGSKIAPEQDIHEPTIAAIKGIFRDWFPALADVAFADAWGGPLGMPRDLIPTASFDPATRIATACGYTGNGLGTSNLAARTLADLILDRPSPLRELPIAMHDSPDWELEPFRWLGARFMQHAFIRSDEAREAGRPLPIDARIAQWYARRCGLAL